MCVRVCMCVVYVCACVYVCMCVVCVYACVVCVHACVLCALCVCVSTYNVHAYSIMQNSLAVGKYLSCPLERSPPVAKHTK